MLKKLRDGADAWHKLAAYLTLLARAGIDTTAIEADTGIERVQQNAWVVAGQVLPSSLSWLSLLSLTSRFRSHT